MDVFRLPFHQAHAHLPALGELDGIPDHVHQDLTDAPPVGEHGVFDPRCHDGREAQPLLLCFGPEKLQHVFDGARQRHRMRVEIELPRLDLREIEQLVDQTEEQPAVRQESVEEIVAPCPLEVLGPEKVGDPQDGAQRSADLVAHVAQEDRLRAIGLFGSLLRISQIGGCVLQLPHEDVDRMGDCVEVVVCRRDGYALGEIAARHVLQRVQQIGEALAPLHERGVRSHAIADRSSATRNLTRAALVFRAPDTAPSTVGE